jgi:hypothetical protein
MTYLCSLSVVIWSVGKSELGHTTIRECKNIRKSFGYESDSSDVNDFAAMFEVKFHGLSSSEEETGTGIV